jgi:hypothetical protein
VSPSRMLEFLLDASIRLYFLGVFGDSAGNLRVVLSISFFIFFVCVSAREHRIEFSLMLSSSPQK